MYVITRSDANIQIIMRPNNFIQNSLPFPLIVMLLPLLLLVEARMHPFPHLHGINERKPHDPHEIEFSIEFYVSIKWQKSRNPYELLWY